MVLYPVKTSLEIPFWIIPFCWLKLPDLRYRKIKETFSVVLDRESLMNWPGTKEICSMEKYLGKIHRNAWVMPDDPIDSFWSGENFMENKIILSILFRFPCNSWCLRVISSFPSTFIPVFTTRKRVRNYGPVICESTNVCSAERRFAEYKSTGLVAGSRQ